MAFVVAVGCFASLLHSRRTPSPGWNPDPARLVTDPSTRQVPGAAVSVAVVFGVTVVFVPVPVAEVAEHG
jgi:hypothetical protein